jgi:hypothetical protein
MGGAIWVTRIVFALLKSVVKNRRTRVSAEITAFLLHSHKQL